MNLGGSVTVPGTPPYGSGSGAGNGTGSGPAGPPAPAVPAAPTCNPLTEVCRDGYTITLPLDGRGPVTLSDLVNFRPTAGVQRMEPDGWTVVGLDTNFFADTTPHVERNLLLGIPAEVRFTPVAFRWNYGDGTSATRTFQGRSWEALRLAEFDATGTSHTYRATGRYTITLTIDFRAEYRFGTDATGTGATGTGATGAWVPILGTVAVASNPLTADVARAKTVLVERDCTTARSGPGC